MKRFIVILLILMLIPVCAFAVESPTIKKMITCTPEIKFELADTREDWPKTLERIDELYFDDYLMLEAVYVHLDKHYDKLEWKLPITIISEHEPFVLLVEDEIVTIQEVSVTEEGAVIVDLTEYEATDFYICFYIKSVD